MKRTQILLPAVALVMLAASASAATIVWNAAANASADTDISTTGSIVDAYNFGDNNSYTINGVSFVGTTTGAGSTEGWGGTAFNAYVAPTNLTAGSNYAKALNVGNYFGIQGARVAKSITGLIAGQTYQIQIWFNDQRSGSSTMTLDDNATPNHSVAIKSGPGIGYAQYAIGTFVADGSTQTLGITGTGANGPTINLYQLRNITPIPEPSLTLLGGLGVLALLRRRNRD